MGAKLFEVVVVDHGKLVPTRRVFAPMEDVRAFSLADFLRFWYSHKELPRAVYVCPQEGTE